MYSNTVWHFWKKSLVLIFPQVLNQAVTTHIFCKENNVKPLGQSAIRKNEFFLGLLTSNINHNSSNWVSGQSAFHIQPHLNLRVWSWYERAERLEPGQSLSLTVEFPTSLRHIHTIIAQLGTRCFNLLSFILILVAF